MTMAVTRALFGKVQTRRDFVAVATPRPFLSLWERWLQEAVAASREALRDKWIDSYLTAPIWRFWLGADLCGATAIGALMPSMDGVGRYFPLTLVMIAEEGAAFAPPEVDAQDDWFEQAEAFLLETLDIHDHDALLDAFARLPAPRNADATPEQVARLDGAASRIAAEDLAFERCFAIGREAEAARAASASTFWWTAGGEGFAPCAVACLRMPSPTVFTAMLTGQFATGAPE